MEENKQNKEPLNKDFKVPKLRFRRFNDYRKKDNLSVISKYYKGGHLSKEDINLEGNIPCVLYGELYTTYLNKIENIVSMIRCKDNLIFAKKDDIILPLTGETSLDISNSAVIPFDGVALGSDLIALRTTLNPLFLSYQLSGKRKLQIASLAQGKSVVHSSPNQLMKLLVFYPSKEEQDKIAQILFCVSKKIELIGLKVEALKKYKRGMVQQLLKSLAKFKLVSLDKLCQITTGKVNANAQVDKGKYKFFTCAKEDFLIDTYAFDTEAILVSGNGDVGLTKYYKGKFNAYQRTYVLYDFALNPLYLKTCIDCQINNIIKKETNKGAMPYIKLSTFAKIKIPILSYEESNNIGTLINCLESKINCCSQIMISINKFKKFLLGNLFI